jgi:hypothetical protein
MEKLYAIANGNDFKKKYFKIKTHHKNHLPDYLRQKWQLLRMYRTRNTFPVDYRIIKHTAKIMGVKHASTRA